MNLCFTLGEVIVCDSLIHSLWQVEIWFPTVASSLGKPRVATHPHRSRSSILRVYGSLCGRVQRVNSSWNYSCSHEASQYIHVYEYIIIDVYTYCTVYLSLRMFPRRNGTMRVNRQIRGAFAISSVWMDTGHHFLIHQEPRPTRSTAPAFCSRISSRSSSPATPIHLSRTQSHRIAKAMNIWPASEKPLLLWEAASSTATQATWNSLEIERYTRPTCDSMMIFESMHPFFWAISSKTHQPREVFEHLGRLWRQLNSVTFLAVRAVSQEGECQLLVPRGKKKGKLFYSPNKNGNSNIRVQI